MIKNIDALIVLEEVSVSLKESAELADKGTEFDNGRRMGYYEALSTILSQCAAAGITADKIGLDGFVPEDLFKKKQAA